MYTLVGAANNRSLRVYWMLEELGLDYTHIDALPGSDEAKVANGTGKVPTLQIDGHSYSDSVAIMTYLGDKHGALTFPAGSTDRLIQDGHVNFVLEELDSLLWIAAKNKFINPKEVRVPEVDAALKWEFARSLERLEERLGEGPYLMGETFTLADILAVHCLNWAFVAKFPEANNRIKAYSKSARSRPGYKAAFAKRPA